MQFYIKTSKCNIKVSATLWKFREKKKITFYREIGKTRGKGAWFGGTEIKCVCEGERRKTVGQRHGGEASSLSQSTPGGWVQGKSESES